MAIPNSMLGLIWRLNRRFCVKKSNAEYHLRRTLVLYELVNLLFEKKDECLSASLKLISGEELIIEHGWHGNGDLNIRLIQGGISFNLSGVFFGISLPTIKNGDIYCHGIPSGDYQPYLDSLVTIEQLICLLGNFIDENFENVYDDISAITLKAGRL